MIAIKLNAGHDRNGNPRRCYVVLNKNGIVEAIDEGYDGYRALGKRYPKIISAIAEFETTFKEYKELLHNWSKNNKPTKKLRSN